MRSHSCHGFVLPMTTRRFEPVPDGVKKMTIGTGQNEHSAPNKPWHVLVSLEFRTAEAAGQFERYLKTGSGRAFAKRHFL